MTDGPWSGWEPTVEAAPGLDGSWQVEVLDASALVSAFRWTIALEQRLEAVKRLLEEDREGHCLDEECCAICDALALLSSPLEAS